MDRTRSLLPCFRSCHFHSAATQCVLQRTTLFVLVVYLHPGAAFQHSSRQLDQCTVWPQFWGLPCAGLLLTSGIHFGSHAPSRAQVGLVSFVSRDCRTLGVERGAPPAAPGVQGLLSSHGPPFRSLAFSSWAFEVAPVMSLSEWEGCRRRSTSRVLIMTNEKQTELHLSFALERICSIMSMHSELTL